MINVKYAANLYTLGFLTLLLAIVKVGVFIVGLNIYPVRFTVMHVALLGAALGLVFSLGPLIPALAVDRKSVV